MKKNEVPPQRNEKSCAINNNYLRLAGCEHRTPIPTHSRRAHIYRINLLKYSQRSFNSHLSKWQRTIVCFVRSARRAQLKQRNCLIREHFFFLFSFRSMLFLRCFSFVRNVSKSNGTTLTHTILCPKSEKKRNEVLDRISFLIGFGRDLWEDFFFRFRLYTVLPLCDRRWANGLWGRYGRALLLCSPECGYLWCRECFGNRSERIEWNAIGGKRDRNNRIKHAKPSNTHEILHSQCELKIHWHQSSSVSKFGNARADDRSLIIAAKNKN